VQTTKTSVHGAINMLGLAKRVRAKMFQASTSEIYGDPSQHPSDRKLLGQRQPDRAALLLRRGQALRETLCFDYHRQHKLRIKVVRIFNTYGPRMHPNDGRVVSNFIVQGAPRRADHDLRRRKPHPQLLLRRRPDRRVPAHDGLPGRGDRTRQSRQSRRVHHPRAGREDPRPHGSRSAIEHRPLPENDPAQRRPDIAKAKALLDWTPTIPLDQGLIRTIDHFEALLSKADADS
jgi:UDP-glucuronate decarboxylase